MEANVTVSPPRLAETAIWARWPLKFASISLGQRIATRPLDVGDPRTLDAEASHQAVLVENEGIASCVSVIVDTSLPPRTASE